MITLLKLSLKPVKLLVFSTLQIKKLRPRKVNLLAQVTRLKTDRAGILTLPVFLKPSSLLLQWMHIDVRTF